MQIGMRYASNVEHAKIPRSTSVKQSKIASLLFDMKHRTEPYSHSIVAGGLLEMS